MFCDSNQFALSSLRLAERAIQDSRHISSTNAHNKYENEHYLEMEMEIMQPQKPRNRDLIFKCFRFVRHH